MNIGITGMPTDQTMPPTELARACEERGFESLFLPDHSHIPVSRRSPWPGSLSGEALPEAYGRLPDPFVALAAAAAATTTLRVGTSVCLVAQRDVLQLAKEVATLDWLSGGRFVFGVGMGWNAEEMADHGVAFPDRWDIVAEKLDALKVLWRDEVASYAGTHVRFEGCWAWPKPAQRPHPPILLGGGWGPRLLEAVCRHADGWLPISSRRTLAERIALLHGAAARLGRDPATLQITVTNARPDLSVLRTLEDEGVSRAMLLVEMDDRDALLRQLDAHAPLAAALG